MCWLDSAWTDGLPFQGILRGEVNAWQNQRNRDVIRVDWRFTTRAMRASLKSLYPR